MSSYILHHSSPHVYLGYTYQIIHVIMHMTKNTLPSQISSTWSVFSWLKKALYPKILGFFFFFPKAYLWNNVYIYHTSIYTALTMEIIRVMHSLTTFNTTKILLADHFVVGSIFIKSNKFITRRRLFLSPFSCS